MFNKEISIVVNRARVVGMIDATPECLTVHILSPFSKLKHSVRFSGSPVGDRRFVCNNKLSREALERAQEILKGLYLAGVALRDDPDFIKRLRKYMARFEKTALMIHQDRKQAMMKYGEGKISKKTHDQRLSELQAAENQNVIGRGAVFRQYSDRLTQCSGGVVDIQSVLEFNS